MKKYNEILIPTPQLHSVTCDVCKIEFKVNGEYPDGYELQEFNEINICGGYGSVFGDGSKCSLHICQHCLFNKLGKFFNYEIDE